MTDVAILCGIEAVRDYVLRATGWAPTHLFAGIDVYVAVAREHGWAPHDLAPGAHGSLELQFRKGGTNHVDSDTAKALRRFRRRFLGRTVVVDGCLVWTGAHDSAGYGNVRVPTDLRDYFGGRRWIKAHLAGLVLFQGVPPDALDHGHHRCRDFGAEIDARDCVVHVANYGAKDHRAEHARRRRRRR